MNVSQILDLIISKILSGGRRTTAENTREVLNEITNSYANFATGGNSFEAEVGYKNAYRPESPEAFASVDMIKGTTSDNPLTELYLQSPDLTIWKITIDNSGIIQSETV